MRKLKTMKQLLEEFPEARFNDQGDLNVVNGAGISSRWLRCLGKETDLFWDERLLVPLEKKPRLLAFEFDEGEVRFVIQDSRRLEDFNSFGHTKHRPEFDIEARQ